MASDNQPAMPKVGIALGSGASRGWSHIGVLKALLKAGIEPDVVCGTSVGAMVGGAYLAGNLKELEDWVVTSSRSDVLRFFSFRLANSAFVDLDRFNWFLHNYVAPADLRIEDLEKPFAAVCTDLEGGSEVMLTNGNLVNSIRASMAMPGLFPAERQNHRWLVDGGLVNPVPVSACRTLGADVVIGVNLNADILGRREVAKRAAEQPEDDSIFDSLKKQARKYSASLLSVDQESDSTPGMFTTIAHTINIFQDQITRSRLEADPADVSIAPNVGDISMFDFQRAADAIEEGETCVQEALADIRRIAGNG